MKTKKNELAPIIFTSGSFELLHPGHVSLLEAAARISKEELSTDLPLVVGVNSDRSVRQYKPCKLIPRPITPEEGRAQLLASLGCVDYVFIFDEPTTTTNIEVLKPQYFVKGKDYSLDQLESTEMTTAKTVGTNVRLVGAISTYDTTEIIRTILGATSEKENV